ncbi:MAG: hypothetical protein FWD84_03330, partial [Oscillospiraceae bacterium]|nr:hypothetical protein [Oscillospiraceae bacterium]
MTYPLFMFFVYVWLSLLPLFIIVKILIRDWKLRLPESVYIVLGTLLCTFFRVIPYVDAFSNLPFISSYTFFLIFTRIFTALLLFLYIYKLKSYSAKKAIILTIFSDLFAFVSDLLAFSVFQLFFDLSSYFHAGQIFLAMSYSLLALILSALIALLVVKTSGKLRKALNTNIHFETALVVGSLIGWLTTKVMSSVLFILEDYTRNIWLLFLLLGYVGSSIVSFFFYSRSQNARFALKQKENEQKNLQFYLDEIEQQQAAIRKFKHDQQNLFSTLDIFVQEKDWDGLTQFYPKVRAVSEIITKNEFELEGLSKIKVREIKNIFIAKLVTAQNLEINTKFEAGEEIDDI